MNIKRIRKTDQQIKQAPDVHRLCDLGVTPAHVAQPLNLFVGDAVRMTRERADEFQQEALCRSQSGLIEIA